MPLVLAPSFDDHTREQIEQHIREVQARRMVAAIEYHSGKDSKLKGESQKLQNRIDFKYEMLRKELAAFDKAHEKLENRLAELEHLKNELGLVDDLRELHQVPTEKEDE